MLADAMGDWFANLQSADFKLAILVAAGVIVVIGWIIVAGWTKVRQSEHRTRLTAMMLEQRRPVDEIERILKVGFLETTAEDASDDPEVQLVKHLTENHYEGDDVEKILAAAREVGPIDGAAAHLVETMAENWVETESIVNVLRSRKSKASDGKVIELGVGGASGVRPAAG